MFALIIFPLLTWELYLLILSSRLLIVLRIPIVSSSSLLTLKRFRLSSGGFFCTRARLVILFLVAIYPSSVKRERSYPPLSLLKVALTLTLILFFILRDTIIIYAIFELSTLVLFLTILSRSLAKSKLDFAPLALIYSLRTSIISLIITFLVFRSPLQQGEFYRLSISLNLYSSGTVIFLILLAILSHLLITGIPKTGHLYIEPLSLLLLSTFAIIVLSLTLLVHVSPPLLEITSLRPSINRELSSKITLVFSGFLAFFVKLSLYSSFKKQPEIKIMWSKLIPLGVRVYLGFQFLYFYVSNYPC